MKDNVDNIATFKEKADAIQSTINPAFYKKMIAYSIFRFNKVFNIKFDLDKGFRGIMIKDIISETVEAFLRPNGRNWNKTTFPNFEKQFISSLDSVISNTVKKELGKVSQTFTLLENDQEEGASGSGHEYEDDKEYKEDIEICEAILAELGATDEEILLFEPYIVNGMKRDALADAYGISVNELTNIKKRLERKLPTLRIELAKRKKS